MAKEVTLTRQIRIFPNVDDQALLKQWMGVVRWTYNQCVYLCNSYSQMGLYEWINEPFFAMFILRGDIPTWVKAVPEAVRSKMFRSFFSARRAALTNLSRGNINHFRFQFKSKKRMLHDSLSFTSREYKNINAKPPRDEKKPRQCEFLNRLNPKHKNKNMAGTQAKIIGDVNHDFNIQHDLARNRWFMNIPYKRNVAVSNRGDIQASVVAIDPGVRTFATCYTPDGYAVEVGAEDRKRLCRLAIAADKVQSRMSRLTTDSRKHRRARVRFKRLHFRIRCLVKDLHRKLSSWLCNTFDVILLPPFKTSEMSKRCSRRLRSKTVRQMLTWSHFQFKQRLLDSAKLHGKVVLIVDESYTSQTCGDCGRRYKSSSKTYKCRHCKYIADRDINGARNILIRTLSQV